MDFSTLKAITIPQGEVAKIEVNGVVIWELPSSYTNQVPKSIDTDRSIYNGTGYKEGYRLNSSGGQTAGSSYVHTGFIPCVKGDVIRCDGNKGSWNFGGQYIAFYKSDFSLIGSVGTVSLLGSYGATEKETSNGVYMLTFDFSTLASAYNNTTYIRVSGTGKGADMIVTVNEEIS